MRRARGFTLVEVLIASAMVGLIGLAIASTLRAAYDADRTLRGRADRRATERAALDAIARDLRSAVPAGGIYASGIVGTQGTGTTGADVLATPDEVSKANDLATSEGTEAPPTDGRDTITLAVLPSARRYGQSFAAGAGAIEQDVWAIDDDPATPERGLVRRPTRVRDPVEGADPEPTEEIAPDVVGMRLRYFDGTTWQDSWDSGASDSMPQAIEVVLAVRDSDGAIHRASTVVAPLTGRPAQQIQPGTGPATGGKK